MQLNGRRRVRSGWDGSEHPPMALNEPPPQPKERPKGKSVRWRDFEAHGSKGYSSFLDLEESYIPSALVALDTGEMAGADALWYTESHYQEERGLVKSEFFQQLGEAQAQVATRGLTWNKLAAYPGHLHLRKIKPRSHVDGAAGASTSHDSDSAPEATSELPSRTPSRTPSRNHSKELRSRELRTSREELEALSPHSSPPENLATRRARPTTPLDTTVGLDHFQVHGLCGEGTFGKVMMATKIDTQKVYAMKVIRKELLYSDATRVTQAIAEKQVMQQMAARPHPYVISLRFAFQTDENIFLVMDFMGGGDLHNLLEAKGRLREAWVVVYAAEIALALEHVHAHGVIFRDLKPENVMIGVDGHLKLTDFGLSKQLGDVNADGEKQKKRGTATICGTPEYIAPEVLMGREYSYEVDWWTFGCVADCVGMLIASGCELSASECMLIATGCVLIASDGLPHQVRPVRDGARKAPLSLRGHGLPHQHDQEVQDHLRRRVLLRHAPGPAAQAHDCRSERAAWECQLG